MNRYGYAGNDPVNMIDPSGLTYCSYVTDEDGNQTQESCDEVDPYPSLGAVMSWAGTNAAFGNSFFDPSILASITPDIRESKSQERQGSPCNQALINFGNSLAGISDDAGTISTVFTLSGLAVAGYGTVAVQPEITGPGLALAETGGAIGIGAGVTQVAAGLFQGFGGGDFDNAWHGAMSLALGYGIKLFTSPPAGWHLGSASQRAAAEAMNRSSTVVGGTYDLLSSRIQALGPQETSCKRH